MTVQRIVQHSLEMLLTIEISQEIGLPKIFKGPKLLSIDLYMKVIQSSCNLDGDQFDPMKAKLQTKNVDISLPVKLNSIPNLFHHTRVDIT